MDDSLLGIEEWEKCVKYLIQHWIAIWPWYHAQKTLQDHITSKIRTRSLNIASLQHPSIPPISRIWHREDGRPFFTMREIRGTSLSTMLRHRKKVSEPWNLRKLISIFQQVCSTIAFAHAQNIIHRDLKPANIMIGEFGEVLVVDWGLAKNIRKEATDDTTADSNYSSDMTLWGTVQGTPALHVSRTSQRHS